MGTIRTARAEWLDRVREWMASGLSAREYASSIEVNPQTLSWWRWKLGRDGEDLRAGDHPGQRRVPATFFELELEEAAAHEATAAPVGLIEVIVGKATLRLPVDFDEASFERVLDVLEARR